ncbi:MAG: extracellular solute-binding protein [Oscillospiraceae bacterium]|jgi:spermidine/putrescine transport system permease protein|nr:extracellular solute-binding protein [Oscillospiraceae bacterium]
MKKTGVFGKIWIGLMMFFLYAPILVLIAFSFNESKSRALFTGFTFKWYGRLLQNTQIMSSFWNSLTMAFTSAALATVIGVLAAVGISKMGKRARSAVMNVTYLPVLNPEIVTGISMMLLFVFFKNLLGSELGFGTVLIAHITFCLPYVILNVLPKLRQVDPNIYEAALDLGCPPVKAFFKVMLPQISSGIVSGFMMSFTFSLDDFIITYFTAGSGYKTLPITIYSMVRKKVNPQINALSAIVFLLVLTMLVVMNVAEARKARRTERGELSVRSGSRAKVVLGRSAMALAAAAAVFVVGLVGWRNYQNGAMIEQQPVLAVFNWGEYISNGEDGGLDVIAAFEEEYGCTVQYDLFSTNEEMYTKLKSGSANYDIVIPSDYMISRMIKEDMLEKLDFNNIPNAEFIMDRFKQTSYDPTGEYTVPYTWGTVGLIYNTTMVEEAPDSWAALWDERYKGDILMFLNSRDAFGIAQKLLGYSQNTTDEAELLACADKLKEQKKVLQTYVMDEIFDKMEIGEAALAPYYAGDALTMIDENPDLAFVLPKEGSNLFIDAMCVIKGSKNKELAENFIDYMCEPEIGKANIEYINYSTPLQTVYDLLDEEVQQNPVSYPDNERVARCDIFVNLPDETNKLVQDLWNEIIAE